MRRRPPSFFHFLFLVLFLFVAGCAGTDHSAHGSGVALLFGAKNATNETVELGWTATALANATVVWTKTETLDPAGVVERISERLATRGEHRVDLSWGEAHQAVFTWTTDDCMGTFHLVVELREDGSAPETTRECHE